MLHINKSLKTFLVTGFCAVFVALSLVVVIVPKASAAATCYTDLGNFRVHYSTHTCPTPGNGINYYEIGGAQLTGTAWMTEDRCFAAPQVTSQGGKPTYREQLCSNLESLRKQAAQAQCGADTCSGANNPSVTPNVTQPSFVKGDCKDNPPTSENCGIIRYLLTFINVLSGLVGVVVVASIIIGGIQYSSAGSDPQKINKAKGRIFNAIFALFVFIFMYSFLQWVVPGGIF